MQQFKQTPLANAISTALAGTVIASAIIVPAEAQDALEEIIVTAQKRTENLQDVPVSVQVLGNKQLTELNLQNFADYMQFIPTASFQTERPGVAQIYIRGISSGGDGVHSGSMPSVGVYLDEQPITTINHVLDMHVYDVARIETLAGPQGTYFGASSESGTIRIITNKPEIGKFDAAVDVGVSSVAHGATGYTGEGFVNIPVSDRSALRLVGWYKQVPGYIDNVHGTLTLEGNPSFTHDNADLVKKDFNDATIAGLRALLKVDLNDNWSVTPGIIYQNQKSNGVWTHDPEDVGDLQVQRYFPDFYDDHWYQASLTVDGDIGDYNLVYAGAYLDRHSDNQSDYIGYAQYWQNYYAYYYGGCYHYDSTGTMCTDSSQYVTGDEDFTRQSHELRLQSPQDGRFRWVAGLFYQRQQHLFDLRWNVPGMDPLGSPIWPGVSVVENDLVVWQTNQLRIDRDKAFFGEVEFDLTDNLTVIGGYRRFDFENSLYGFNGWVGRCLDNGVPQYPCFDFPNLDDVSEGNGNIYKFSMNYNLNDTKMLYATYSEGFRPGGVNRATVSVPKYLPDFVKNYEFGWKTTWLDNRLRFNGAAYLLDWDNFQFSFLDQAISPLTIIQNIGQARTIGTEFDLTFAATDDVLLTLAGSYNDAELREPYYRNDQERIDGLPPRAPVGTKMPFVPRFQFTTTGRFNFDVGRLPAYAQAAISYKDASWSLLEVELRQKQPAYTIVNLATGLQTETWSLDLFLDNVADERAQIVRYHRDYLDPYDVLVHDTTITTNRPRTIGLRYGYRFE